MRYGNYWNDDQIIIGSVIETDRIPSAVIKDTGDGAPAFIAMVHDSHLNILIEYIFVEIIPGSEHQGNLPSTSTATPTETFVNVNIYSGPIHKFEEMSLITQDSWPLSWFRLTKVPAVSSDPYDDYERAMAIIGG
jgi:hypothetical protein